MPQANFAPGASGNPLDTLLAGGNLYGTSGFNIANSFLQTMSGGTADPRLGQYGYNVNTQMESPVKSIGGNFSGYTIDPNGYIVIDGKQYSQLGSTQVGGPEGVIDPSLVQNNSQFGLITPVNNINQPHENFWDKYGGYALLAPAAVSILGGAFAAGGTTAAEGGTTAATAGGTAGATAGGTTLSTLGIDATPIAAQTLPEATTMLPASAAFAGTPYETGGILSTLGLGGGTGSNISNAGRLISVINALGGGGGGNTGGNMGSTGAGGLLSLLGLLGLGRQGGLFGGGTGTPGGAQQAGQNAANAADPWGASGQRTQAQQALTPGLMMQLLGLDPQGLQSDITKDPGYQFALNQGVNAINMGDASQGTLRSGNRGVELQQFGTGLAAQYENQFRTENLQSLGLLANMGGLNSSNPTAAGGDILSGFTGGTNLQNSGLSGLLGSLLSGSSGGGGLGSILGGLGGLLSSGAGGISDFFTNLFGGSSGGLSDSEISALISGIGGGTTSDNLFGGLGDALAGP